MKNVLTTTIVIPILAATIMLSCGETEEPQAVERSVSVRATVVQPTERRVVRSFTGSLEGERQATIYARLSEAVEKVHVREGQTVTAGQILVSFDKNGASSRYVEAESVFRNSEKTFKKMEYLFGEGAVSESQFDEAKTVYDVNRASFDAASKLVSIEAPISGVVTSLSVTQGDFPTVGTVLGTVAATERLRVRFSVNAEELAHFSRGAEVEVSIGENGTRSPGEVTSVSESADPVTRSFEVEVVIDNTDHELKAGTFATIEVVVDHLENVFIVGRETITALNDRNIVYLVSNGVANQREVQLGVDVEGGVVVRSGLNPGDTLVTLGQSYLSDGTSVKVASLEQTVR